MGLIKSLFLAAKSDTRAYNEAMRIHNAIQIRLSGLDSVSPIQLDQAIQDISGDKIISQGVLQAVGFKSIIDSHKPIDFNKLFDAILMELNKRYQG